MTAHTPRQAQALTPLLEILLAPMPPSPEIAIQPHPNSSGIQQTEPSPAAQMTRYPPPIQLTGMRSSTQQPLMPIRALLQPASPLIGTIPISSWDKTTAVCSRETQTA